MADLAAPRARLYRFGPFDLDVRAGELRKHGIRIKLREQPVQILLLMLEHPGEVVLREEIRLRLWPNNTIVEFDHGINAAIQKVRDALGESAEAPGYVETVARRGYRFLGEVERIGEPRQPEPQAAVPPESAASGELIGRVVSHFRILDKLGEGGMGVVYRAEDLKLGRQVALKFLPCAARELPGSMLQRFEREARAASALNHPHICTIHGLEDLGGQPAIIMELVEGETLSVRLSKGPLPGNQALGLASQIASALWEAHRKGIVHRDLKPANIMLTKSGAKVLDFGLAKMQQPVEAAQETATMEGTIMGTLHYMSPEQAQGKEADSRSDIFSFGVVLYEMLSGKRAFDGETAASVMAGILEREPPPLAPPPLDRVVRRCLAKDPEERWQSAWDLKTELEWVAQTPPAHAVPGSVVSRWRTRAGWIAAGVLAVALAAFLAIRLRERSGDTPVVRFTIPAPEKTTLAIANVPTGGPTALALSPDGRRLAFVATSVDGTSRLWIRPLDAVAAQPLSGSEGASVPFWSPDSRFLGFWAAGKLKKIDLNGGPSISLCDAFDARGGTWNGQGQIVFAPSHTTPLFLIAASGGAPTQLTKLDAPGEIAHRFPQFLPDGRHFLFAASATAGPAEHLTIRAGSLDSPDSRVLLEAGSNAIYAKGYLLFVREGMLMAEPFDPRRLATTGEAVPVAEHIRRANTSGRGIFDASESGLLVYQADTDTSIRQLVWGCATHTGRIWQFLFLLV